MTTATGIPAVPLDQEPLPDQPGADHETALREVLSAAGVELGTHDERIVQWAGQMLDWATLATIASWVKRAAERPAD